MNRRDSLAKPRTRPAAPETAGWPTGANPIEHAACFARKMLIDFGREFIKLSFIREGVRCVLTFRIRLFELPFRTAREA